MNTNKNASRAPERTLLNWQRTIVSMLAMSVICFKISTLTAEPLLLGAAIVAFLCCLVMATLHVSHHLQNKRHSTVAQLAIAATAITLLGAVCSLFIAR